MLFPSIPFTIGQLPLTILIYLVFMTFFIFSLFWLCVSLVYFMCTWVVSLRFLMNFDYL
jgi:hypothetical protein